MQIKNRPDGQGLLPAHDIVSPDALALVRFGLRAPTDRRILDTMAAIDHGVRVDLPTGPCWYRYTGDGYGEHRDGRPFDGVGQGRLWPLLTGERAHIAVAAGDQDGALALLAALETFTSRGALIPEQIWDADDIPDRELYRGHPSGSAMPLVWAHSEHIKLLRSLADGQVFDRPPQTVRRYQTERHPVRVTPWRLGFRPDALERDRVLRVELAAPSVLVWSGDGWASSAELTTTDTGLGVHVAELAAVGSRIEFTWRVIATDSWAGENYAVRVS